MKGEMCMNSDVKKVLKICGCIFLLFLCIFYWQTFVTFLGVALSAASPLILGGVVAFIVNILMSKYEKWFFAKTKKKIVLKIRRPICMILAFLTAIVVLAVIIYLVVPQLISCINVIIAFFKTIPGYISEFVVKAKEWDFIPEKVLVTLSSIDWESRITQFAEWMSSGVGDVVNTLAKTVMGIVSGIITTVIGLIFSIYLLLDKDRLKRQFKKIAKTYTPKKVHEKVFYFVAVLNDSFRRFIVGQISEALIIGLLCTFGMMIFRFPYATMIGALIAVTALIPIAGAYIGAITGAIVILTVSPIKALWFLVFILILQQLEGNIIYPRVVGSSLGLPGIWVLAAVTIGGGCFGILGMLIGVPLTSAVYRIITEDTRKKAVLEEKNVIKEPLPESEGENDKTDEEEPQNLEKN